MRLANQAKADAKILEAEGELGARPSGAAALRPPMTAALRPPGTAAPATANGNGGGYSADPAQGYEAQYGGPAQAQAQYGGYDENGYTYGGQDGYAAEDAMALADPYGGAGDDGTGGYADQGVYQQQVGGGYTYAGAPRNY